VPHDHPQTPAVNVNLEVDNSSHPTGGCIVANERERLAAADDFYSQGELEQAFGNYGKLLGSCDDKTKKAASEGYELSRKKKGEWWWRLTSYVRSAGLQAFLPQIRDTLKWWIHQIGDPAWWCRVLRWPFLQPYYYPILLFGLLIIGLSHKPSPRYGILFIAPWLLRKIFMPKFTGQATIVLPADLGKEAQVALFASSLQSNAALARSLLSGDQNHLQVRPSTYFSVSSDFAKNTFNELPELGGVKLAGFFQMILGVGRYFSWRIETDLAFFPSAAGQASRMNAVCTPRWGWHSEDPISCELDVADAQDVDELAFAIAARILARHYD
jgi:hypothetical protein